MEERKPRGGGYQEEKRLFYPRKRFCRFCKTKDLAIDFKDNRTLKSFVNDRGRILPRRITGLCARHQRAVAREIKKARVMSLVSYTPTTEV